MALNRNDILERAENTLSEDAFELFERLLPLGIILTEELVEATLTQVIMYNVAPPIVRDVAFISPLLDFSVDLLDSIYD